MRLYTYTIPYDDGAAPNPFHGMCTLAICKPRIRSTARVGDWVAGFGSINAPSGDLSGHLVYAMRVEEVLTMEEYDRHASVRWPHRIPNTTSLDLADRLGDCIYDYSTGALPSQRPGVHSASNARKDLSGKNVLISQDFCYFGASALPLPSHLRDLCHQTQGHRCQKNTPYVDLFIGWLRGLNLESGQIYGWPDYVVDWTKVRACACGQSAGVKVRASAVDC